MLEDSPGVRTAGRGGADDVAGTVRGALIAIRGVGGALRAPVRRPARRHRHHVHWQFARDGLARAPHRGGGRQCAWGAHLLRVLRPMDGQRLGGAWRARVRANGRAGETLSAGESATCVTQWVE